MNREQILARQQEILAAAKTAGRPMTPEELTEFDSLQKALESMGAPQAPGEPESLNGVPGEFKELPDADDEPEGDTRGADDPVVRERERVAEISDLCRAFGVDATGYIRNGATVENVRAAVLKELRGRSAPINSRIQFGESGRERFLRAATDGMLIRGGMAPHEPAQGARDFAGYSLRDMAIQCVRMDGGNVAQLERMSSGDLFDAVTRQFFTPESSFPAMLDNVVGKAVVEAYTHTEVAFDKFTKKGSLPDFKKYDNYYTTGPLSEYEEVSENGELKADTFEMKKRPQRQLKTYGKQFSLSRKAFIDDDIGVVTSMPAKYAAAAKRTINNRVFQYIVGTEAIYDGLPLFCAQHENLLKKGSGITFEAVQNMLLALSGQKDEFGQAIVVRPAVLLIPVGLEFDVYTLFQSDQYPTTDNDGARNPLKQYANKLQIISDPTLNALAGTGAAPWFLIGNSQDVSFIEVDYLNGQEVPSVRPGEVIGKLGIVWDSWIDVGVTVMDWRGAVKNPGIALALKGALATA